MTPYLLLVLSLLAVAVLLRLRVRDGDVITGQARYITALEGEVESLVAEREASFRPRPLPEWVTTPSDVPPMIQGRPRPLALPAPIDLPYDAATTAPQPIVGGPRESRSREARAATQRRRSSRVPAGPSYGGSE